MTCAEWVALFGKSTFDPQVRTALARAGVTAMPVIPRDEVFTLVQVGEGMMVNFSEEGMFNDLEEPVGTGTPVVAAVTMLLADPNETLYTGPLPFGVSRNDGRTELRQHFGPPEDSFDAIPSDEWTIEGLVLRVLYADDLKSILQLRLTHPDAN